MAESPTTSNLQHAYHTPHMPTSDSMDSANSTASDSDPRTLVVDTMSTLSVAPAAADSSTTSTTSALSTTAPVADPSIPPASGRCPLLELPRELRNKIWTDLLVPDEPIGCTPLQTAQHRYDNDLSFWYGPEAAFISGREWHFTHYKETRKALPLLAANKQNSAEATPIYYAQPFRFSGDVGWVVLWHWLMHLGPKQRNLVKDITVCHPALTNQPACGENVGELDDSILGPYSMKLLLDSSHKLINGPPQTPLLEMNPDPRQLLQQMAGLSRLRLLIPHEIGWPEPFYPRNLPWTALATDPLLDLEFPRKKLEKSIVNLAPYAASGFDRDTFRLNMLSITQPNADVDQQLSVGLGLFLRATEPTDGKLRSCSLISSISTLLCL